VGLTDILNTARDAMSAQTFGLTITGQNVANVNTPGYVRRQPLLETLEMGSGNYGSVQAAGLRRVADEFVNQRSLVATGSTGEASSRDSLLGQAEALFNDFNGTGLGASMNNLFSAFSAVAASPTDLTARADLLGKAQTFAGQVSSTADQLQSFRVSLFSQARDLTNQINGKLDSIADLSGQINQAKAQGQEPADLEDKRDAALSDLAQMIDIHTYTDGNGQLVVQGPGVTLMQSDVARHLTMDVGADGSARVIAQNSSGVGGGDITSFLGGGQLSGILQVRDTDVVQMQGELDKFAYNVANQINSVHSAGFGLDGQGGRQLFAVSATEAGAASSLGLSADVADHPEFIAASDDASQVPGNGNQATLLAKASDTPIANLGNQSPSEAYSALVGDVGQRKADAASTLSTRQAVSQQVDQVKQSVSGVSLDEEMVAMSQYQRAFEAASRVFTTADQLLQDLLNTVGK
jgi:flagellar hook-associated protein 1 FlgK